MIRKLHRPSPAISLSGNRLTGTSPLIFALFALALFPATSMAQSIPLVDRRLSETRHLDFEYTMPVYGTRDEWLARADHLRGQILSSAGLSPMPLRPPIKAEIFGRQDLGDHTIEKVLFESLPGFYVTGNLYRPKNPNGRVPAVLNPHGHWTYGRLENTPVASVPIRAANFARLGMVAFTYDMVGYNDSIAISHKFAIGHREGFDAAALWSVNLLGLQLWNSIRSLDFLLTLPEVDPERIASTGASGGATQTFLHAAIDSRVKVAAPVNMISATMQGGSLCENAPNLRIDTNNMEFGALIAPRPMLMVAATGDWTHNTLRVEYPRVKSVYSLFGAEQNIQPAMFTAPHNYNQKSREAVYGWFAHHLLGRESASPLAEQRADVSALPDVLVFHGRARPDNELDERSLLASLILRAKQQFNEAWPRDNSSLETFRGTYGRNLSYSLMAEYPKPENILTVHTQTGPGVSDSIPGGEHRQGILVSRRGRGDRLEADLWTPASAQNPRSSVLVVIPAEQTAGEDAELRTLIEGAQSKDRPVLLFRASPSSTRPPGEIKFLTTYNRSAEANGVQDILTLIAFMRKRYPNAELDLVGRGRAGLLALLARGLAPRIARVAIDVDGLDTSSDEAFVGHLPIPGLRRAGDFATAVVIAPLSPLLIYNTKNRFSTELIASAFQLLGRPSDLRVVAESVPTSDLLDWILRD